MNLRRALPSLLLLALGLPARAVDDGPLGVGTPGTFRMLFLEMPLQDARPAGGRGRLEMRWWLGNDWSVPTRLRKGSRLVQVRQDAQTDVLQLAWTVPWSRLRPGLDGWQTTAELRVLARWGGWTDGVISRWHDLVGSTNFSRGHYPENRVNLEMVELGGGRSIADLHRPGLALSDLALRTQGTLLQGAPLRPGGPVPWTLALRADLELPTGRLASLGGSGGVDAGAGLTATWAPLDWLTLHSLGEVRLIAPMAKSFPLQPAPVQWGLGLSLVVRLGDSVALLGEDRLSSPLFRGGWSLLPGEPDPQATAWYGLFRPYNQLSAGVRVGEVTIYFSEDFTLGSRLPGDDGPQWFYNSNAPDFVLGVSWARRL